MAPGSAPSQLPPQLGQGQLVQEKKVLAQAVPVEESLPRAHRHVELRHPGSVPWKSPGALLRPWSCLPLVLLFIFFRIPPVNLTFTMLARAEH